MAGLGHDVLRSWVSKVVVDFMLRIYWNVHVVVRMIMWQVTRIEGIMRIVMQRLFASCDVLRTSICFVWSGTLDESL